MNLQHLHLPGLTPYRLVSAVQDVLVRGKIAYHRKLPGGDVARTSDAVPTLVTFTTPPTYTSGRRQHLDTDQIRTLRSGNGPSSSAPNADFVASPRGGLLTFHGPGQLTAYPIIHLRSHGLTPRTYIRLLEETIIRTLAVYGVNGFTRDEYPGVWVASNQKLASIGVHVQRGVTCYGTGMNVSTAAEWWQRFTACGIEGVDMVGLVNVGVDGLDGPDGVLKVGETLAQQLAKSLAGVEGVDAWSERQARPLLETAKQRMALGSE